MAGFEVRVRLVVGEFDVGVLEGNAGGRGCEHNTPINVAHHRALTGIQYRLQHRTVTIVVDRWDALIHIKF